MPRSPNSLKVSKTVVEPQVLYGLFHEHAGWYLVDGVVFHTPYFGVAVATLKSLRSQNWRLARISPTGEPQ